MSKTYIPIALQRQVYKRAGGCCEYCLLPDAATFAPHELDHIIAEKHGGLTIAENLSLACTLCNKHKGSDIASIDPETEQLTALFHPRHDLWQEHFVLSNAEITPLTAKGRVTTRLLQLNRQDRLKERRLLLQSGVLNP